MKKLLTLFYISFKSNINNLVVYHLDQKLFQYTIVFFYFYTLKEMYGNVL